jgi:NAD(P)-dependent dehydrogenase (short-subunit alcohol dehydrogenase family)
MVDNRDSVQGDQVLGDKIVIGDVASSVMAVGKGAQVIIQSAHRTVEEARQQKQYEREMLAGAVAKLAAELAPKDDQRPPEGNPYLSINTFRLEHTAVFFGRSREISEVAEQLSRHRCVVLYGGNRVGKSSFLQAGLIPTLVSNQHLPLCLHVSSRSESLVEDIRHELLPDLPVRSDSEREGLSGQRLHSLLRSAAGVLPEGKHLFVIIDQFEVFFSLDKAIQDEFIREIGSSLQDTLPRVRWALSMRPSTDMSLLDLAKDVPGLVDNRYELAKLSRDAARRAIVEPAQQVGLTIDEDLQSTLLDDLGGEQIDPSVLQQVCYALVEGLPPGQKRLTLSGYEKLGEVEGVMGGYLADRLAEFPETEKEAAWLALNALAERMESGRPLAEMTARLELDDVASDRLEPALSHLERVHLVRSEGDRYHLASEHFEQYIMSWVRAWYEERAVGERLKSAVRRQGRIIRLSAARGLLGGFIGFGLVYLINRLPLEQFTWTFVGDAAMYRASWGGIMGLLFVLAADLANDVLRDRRRRVWRYLAGGAAGFVFFALMVGYHSLLNLSLRFDPRLLWLDMLEGAIWGLGIGLGTIWIMRDDQRSIVRAFAEIGGMSLIGGAVVILLESLSIGAAFGSPLIQIGLVGAALPFLILLSAYLPRLWIRDRAGEFGDDFS